jgi:hypothetical protein
MDDRAPGGVVSVSVDQIDGTALGREVTGH